LFSRHIPNICASTGIWHCNPEPYPAAKTPFTLQHTIRATAKFVNLETHYHKSRLLKLRSDPKVLSCLCYTSHFLFDLNKPPIPLYTVHTNFALCLQASLPLHAVPRHWLPQRAPWTSLGWQHMLTCRHNCNCIHCRSRAHSFRNRRGRHGTRV
jgi:hypothetical protein